MRRIRPHTDAMTIPVSLSGGGWAQRTVPDVTGPHVIPSLPAYIPVEVCDTVGLDAAQPDGVAKCMAAVQSDVRDDGVSAPAADVEALRQVVSDARQEGVDLKIVVLPSNPGIDTPLRDIATEVGQANPGATVLALSPSFAGTYSPTIDRVTLEAGQDVAKTGDPVLSAKNFVSEISTPDFPWTALALALIVGVAGAATLTRVLQRRSKQLAGSEASSATSE